MADSAAVRQLLAEWAEQAALLADDGAWRKARAPFPATPLALFAQLEEVLELWTQLRSEPLGELAGRYVNGAWTLKDLLGHLASWAHEFRREVETVTRGESFDYVIPGALSVMGPNEWNSRQAEVLRPVPLAEIFASFEDDTRWFQDQVLSLSEAALYGEARFPLSPSGDPAALFKGPIAFLVLGKCQHDLYHLGRIRELLERWTR